MRRVWWMVLAAVLVSCGGDDKKKKEAKPPTPKERAERFCQARCDRDARCSEDDDEVDRDACLTSCRLTHANRMHPFRPRFVNAYADCLGELGCKKEPELCREVAIATVMEDPEEDDTKDDKPKGEQKAKTKGDAKKSDDEKKKKKKKKKDPEDEKRLAEERAGAAAARELFARCHDRRLGCDGLWEDRCDASVALNDGGRERIRECLNEPCSAIRRCMQDAVSW